MSTFSDNLKNFRIFRGLSQRQIAMAVNKTSAVISNWEKGINSPDLDSLEVLCKVLDVTPNELLGWEQNEEFEKYKLEQEVYLRELDKLTRAKAELEKQIDDMTKMIRTGRPENQMENGLRELLHQLNNKADQ